MQARKDWHKIVKLEKSNVLQPRLHHPEKLYFRIKGETMSFPEKKKLKEFITTIGILRAMLKELFQEEEKIKNMNNKIAIMMYLSTIPLKVNGLHTPIKRHRVVEMDKKT